MTRTSIWAACFGLALAAAPVASAEVVRRAEDGFTVRYEGANPAGPRAFQAMRNIARWWDPAHTYSGDSRNLTLAVGTPGACFCERWREGAIKHGEVLLTRPQRMVRIGGAFGPLQAMAATGVFTVDWAEPGRVTMTYEVSGPDTGALADAVDAVIGSQFRNFSAELGRLAR